MTEDTKRALEIIGPVAKELNIEVSADYDFLYCNGQAIGIAYNSTYATLKEFFGYAMIWIGNRDYRYKVPENYKKELKRYWFTDDQIKKMRLRGSLREDQKNGKAG